MLASAQGIPDVAAQARSFLIVYQGETTTVDGTSCAVPTFAAFVSMLNDARMTTGKPPLGFLNPWLYEKGYAGLNDITAGNNPGCGTEGFNATVGWDPGMSYRFYWCHSILPRHSYRRSYLQSSMPNSGDDP